MNYHKLLTFVFSLLIGSPLFAQNPSAVVTKVYKEIDTVSLEMDIHYPEDFSTKKPLPSIIFYFGGGWNGGSIEQFRPHAKYFASRGIIAVLADYRVLSRHGTTPFEAVRDAKSALRFLREHHLELGIDPNKIIAAGGSAGGHLAAATGNVKGLEEANENLSVSSKANALVLFNPVYDNGPDQYGYDRIGDRYKEISPKHNIRKGAPPTIVFFGTEDPLVSPATAKSYEAAMKAVGSRCETYLYEGQPHGFFNFRKQKYYRETVFQADRFLTSLGYLQGEPTLHPKINVVIWDEQQKKQLEAYPNYLGNQIADYLKKNESIDVHSVKLDDPNQGLDAALLEKCEVMIWWGHVRHKEISPETSKKLIERVKSGKLQMIFLHSAHWANPFVEAMNEITRQRVEKQYADFGKKVKIEYAYIPDSLRFKVPKLSNIVTPSIYERKFSDGRIKVKVDMPICVFPFYRADGKSSTIFTLQPKHPIATGISEQFTLPATEMYDEPFHIPAPDEVIFEERWATGEWFRSGSLWNLGKGKVFYFRPGHESYPVYMEEMPLKIVENTVLWMKGYL